MTETLVVDPSKLASIGETLRLASQQIPGAPSSITVSGTDALSQAVKAGSSLMDAPLLTLPTLKTELTALAEKISQAGTKYTTTDTNLADAIKNLLDGRGWPESTGTPTVTPAGYTPAGDPPTKGPSYITNPGDNHPTTPGDSDNDAKPTEPQNNPNTPAAQDPPRGSEPPPDEAPAPPKQEVSPPTTPAKAPDPVTQPSNLVSPQQAPQVTPSPGAPSITPSLPTTGSPSVTPSTPSLPSGTPSLPSSTPSLPSSGTPSLPTSPQQMTPLQALAQGAQGPLNAASAAPVAPVQPLSQATTAAPLGQPHQVTPAALSGTATPSAPPTTPASPAAPAAPVTNTPTGGGGGMPTGGMPLGPAPSPAPAAPITAAPPPAATPAPPVAPAAAAATAVPVTAARAERDAVAAATRRHTGNDPISLAVRIAAALNAPNRPGAFDLNCFWALGVTADGRILAANSYGIGYIPEGQNLPPQVIMVSADPSIPAAERAHTATRPWNAVLAWCQHHDIALRTIIGTPQLIANNDLGCTKILLEPSDIPDTSDMPGRTRLEILAPQRAALLTATPDAYLGELLPAPTADTTAPTAMSWFDEHGALAA